MMLEIVTWTTAVASLFAVVLNIKKHPGCFAIWLTTNMTWAIVDFTKGIVAQAALQGAYAALSYYGLVTWLEKKAAEVAPRPETEERVQP